MARRRRNCPASSPVASMLERVDDSRYYGGKSAAGTWQWLISLMCTHAEYVEPFAGKGGLFRRKPAALRSMLIDLDPDVCGWWKRLAWPGARIVNGDGIAWLEEHAAVLHYDRIIYCDPPYLLTTRKRKKLYRFEMTGKQHRRLLQAVLGARCAVMLSGYASRLYDEALVGWKRFTRKVMTRGGTKAEEVCWLNYDPDRATPALATAYHALGATFRERERVAKRIRRWVSSLMGMPPIERRAILLSLFEAERDLPTPASSMRPAASPAWACRSLLDVLDEER